MPEVRALQARDLHGLTWTNKIDKLTNIVSSTSTWLEADEIIRPGLWIYAEYNISTQYCNLYIVH